MITGIPAPFHNSLQFVSLMGFLGFVKGGGITEGKVEDGTEKEQEKEKEMQSTNSISIDL